MSTFVQTLHRKNDTAGLIRHCSDWTAIFVFYSSNSAACKTNNNFLYEAGEYFSAHPGGVENYSPDAVGAVLKCDDTEDSFLDQQNHAEGS